MSTIYDEMIAAGVPCENHYSDLYVPVTDATRGILAKYPEANVTVFSSSIDGKLWYDIAFAYAPFWQSRGVDPQ
jgi:hypothetical protein